MVTFVSLGAARRLFYTMEFRGGEYSYAEECRYWRERELRGEVVANGYTCMQKGDRYPITPHTAYEIARKYRYHHSASP